MDAVKIYIHKNSTHNQCQIEAKKLNIPFDGIVYASILYMLDHGLGIESVTEFHLSEETRCLYMSEFIANLISDKAKRLNISDEYFITLCLSQILWCNNYADTIREYYYNRKLDDGSARKISKTK
jgi:hypothetical protein